MGDLISEATSQLTDTQKNAGKTAAAIEVAKHQYTKKQSEYDVSLQSGDLARMKVSAKEKAELETIISDLELKLETEQKDIETKSAEVEQAKRQTARNQLADEKEKTLSKQKQYAKTAYRDLKKALESINAIRDMSKENNADSDRLISAVVSSEMYHSCPFLFHTEYHRYDVVTALKVLPIVNGSLGRDFKSSDEAVPFDEAFHELILNPINEEIEGLRAGKVDVPEAKSEPVEIKPEPKPVRKSIYVLKHFYATYQGRYRDPADKPFYAYQEYIVPEAFAIAVIANGYALDTSDPDYPDKLKRHEYSVTAANKPIREDEISLKNTPHLGDPGGFLSNSED